MRIGRTENDKKRRMRSGACNKVRTARRPNLIRVPLDPLGAALLSPYCLAMPRLLLASLFSSCSWLGVSLLGLRPSLGDSLLPLRPSSRGGARARAPARTRRRLRGRARSWWSLRSGSSGGSGRKYRTTRAYA